MIDRNYLLAACDSADNEVNSWANAVQDCGNDYTRAHLAMAVAEQIRANEELASFDAECDSPPFCHCRPCCCPGCQRPDGWLDWVVCIDRGAGEVAVYPMGDGDTFQDAERACGSHFTRAVVGLSREAAEKAAQGYREYFAAL
jgi:hypothetical protein